MRLLLLLAATAGGATLAPELSPTPDPQPVVSPASAGPYSIDPVHSGVLFRIGHLGVSHFWGRFNHIEGSFELAEEAEDCSVEVTIQADSVDTNSEQRDKHVRNPDFLNAAEFPEITFESDRVEIDGDQYTVHGDLTLLGKDRDVTISLTKIGEGDTRMGHRCGFEGEFTFDRKDFGITSYDGPLGAEIRCTVFVEGVKE